MEVRFQVWQALSARIRWLRGKKTARQKHQTKQRQFESLEARAVMAADPFTIAVLPDTQYYAESYPATLNAQTQWIVDNRSSHQIAFVTQLGDIVDSAEKGTDRNLVEWQRADAAFDKLDGNLATNPDGLIPYSVTLGNHDYGVVSDKTSGTSRYQENFGPTRYQGRSWYTESSGIPGAHAQVFSASGNRFLHLTVQFEPSDSDLAWAQKVIDAHPGMPTIFSTHSYLNPGTKLRQSTIQGRSGTTPTVGNTGEQVFQKFVATNNQIFMVLNGHFTGEHQQTSLNNFGQPVFEMVSDYQGRQNGGDGWMRLLEFRPADNRIDVKTYSPTRQQYETDSNSQFSLSLNFNTRFGAPLPAGSQVVTFQNGRVLGKDIYQGTIDTQLRQNAPNTNYRTSTNTLLVDAPTAGQNNTSQSLLQFKQIIGSQPGQIPAGAKILNAKLVLNTTNPGAGAKLHRMMKAWTGNETWNSMQSGIQTNNIEASSTYTAQAGTSAKTPIIPVTSELSINVTTDLQSWANGTPNYGWALMSWSGGTDGWAFSPSEAAFADRPTLQVEWVLPTTSVSTFQQGTHGYTAATDTMIRVATPTTQRATDSTLWADGPDSNGTTHSLIRFADLFSNNPGSIPAGAVIESAKLYLTTPATEANAGGGGATLHRLLQTWDPTVTWSTSFGGNGIQLNNIEARTTADRNTGSVRPGSYGFDVTASLLAWQNGAANHGWVLNANNSNGWAFNSSEHQARDERPKLVVVWSLPATTVSVAKQSTTAPENDMNVLHSAVSSLATIPVVPARPQTVSSANKTVPAATVLAKQAPVIRPVQSPIVWANWPIELRTAKDRLDLSELELALDK